MGELPAPERIDHAHPIRVVATVPSIAKNIIERFRVKLVSFGGVGGSVHEALSRGLPHASSKVFGRMTRLDLLG